MANRTLVLTTPFMKGEDVKRAQYVLNGHNVFEQDYLPGAKLDSEYGPMTAQAAYRAHYWAGFELGELELLGHNYGGILDGILTGRIKANEDQKKLRNKRIHASHERPLREKAFVNLVSHMGEAEHPPGSNRSYASVWYGLIGAWCAMAVTEAYASAGSKAFVRGVRYAYVPFLEADARLGRNSLSMTHDPKRGDLVTYDWEQDGESDHVSMFDEWIEKGSTFHTAGGNEDGQVRRNERRVSQIGLKLGGSPMFIHVGS